MRTYPIMLALRGRRAVVVGAGAVGLRKALPLRDAGARVLLVAPDIPDGADLEGIEVLREPYRPEVLEGAMLVFACTDQRETNARIAADARSVGALVNVADTPEECDFYLPATASAGEVVVAVGSGGSAPGLAAWVRDQLASALPQRVGEFAALLEELRGDLKAATDDGAARMALMKQLIADETHEAFLRGGEQAVRDRLAALLGRAEGTPCPPRKPSS